MPRILPLNLRVFQYCANSYSHLSSVISPSSRRPGLCRTLSFTSTPRRSLSTVGSMAPSLDSYFKQYVQLAVHFVLHSKHIIGLLGSVVAHHYCLASLQR